MDSIWKLWHVISVGLFAGGLLAILVLQGLIAKTTDATARKTLAEAAATAGLRLIMPTMYLAFFSGLLYWAVIFRFKGGPYIHVMLTFGFFAVGLAQMWKAQARKLAAALGAGEAAAEVHLAKGSRFAALAFLLTIAAFIAAILKFPPAR